MKLAKIRIKRGFLYGLTARQMHELARAEDPVFYLPIGVPSWAVRGPYRVHGRWMWMGFEALSDVWPDRERGIRAPIRERQNLCVAGGECELATVQLLTDGRYELTWRFADGALAKPEFWARKSWAARPRVGQRRTFAGRRRMVRLALRVTSVEPALVDQQWCWAVRYTVLFHADADSRVRIPVFNPKAAA